MNKRIIKCFFAVFVFILPIYIYLNPPTDSDGGPMLAYNFLFFYPILFLATIISIILIYVGLKDFRNHKIENTLTLASTLPTVFLTVLVAINIFRIQGEEQFEEEKDKRTSSVIVKVNDNLTLTLEGYSYKEIRKKVTFTPNKEKRNYFTSNQFVQGKYGSFYLYYKVKNDSLEIYMPEEEPLYFMDDGFKRLPLKVFYTNKIPNNNNLKKFEW